MSNPYEAIVQYGVAETSNNNAWATLVASVVLHNPENKEELNEALLPYEDQYMETFHAENEEAKDSKGKWKYRTYMPKSYPSAKSTIAGALTAGVSLLDDNGNPVPKSKVSKAIAEAKADASEEKTWLEKAQAQAESLIKTMNHLDHEEQEVILALLRI